ncbi:hypothetical protein H6P81_012943 [Aristolochia fimbriata]|uniref:Uncharacterized protein n=1 Tax=Aristolochia fimbriata TaxID=158543 RepID=A0AAV7EFF5_ARIFI|nr:hypothetical protein H6P81_012943 [Aristolochia fimbriata]
MLCSTTKGVLVIGHPDGSIRVWDIEGQIAKYAWEVKAHKKQIICVALFEPGDSLLTGSSDKTVKVWQMKKRKLECVQVRVEGYNTENRLMWPNDLYNHSEPWCQDASIQVPPMLTLSIYEGYNEKHLLEFNDHPDLTHEDREKLIDDLVREITGEKIVGSDLHNICSEDTLDVLLEARTRLLQMGRDRLMQAVVLIK